MARVQDFKILGPLPSRPIALLWSSEESILKTSSSEIVSSEQFGSPTGKRSGEGRVNELVVKTEWKYLLKSVALSRLLEAETDPRHG